MGRVEEGVSGCGWGEGGACNWNNSGERSWHWIRRRRRCKGDSHGSEKGGMQARQRV